MKLFRLASLLLALSTTPWTASAAQGEVKVPRSLPLVQDVKTVAPPVVTEPSKFPSLAGLADVGNPPARPELRTPRGAARVGSAMRAQHGLDRVLTSQPEAGVIWARGAPYKARFDVEGATYVPFLGSSAPVNHPVRFTTSAVSVGESSIECAAAAPVLEGETITFARGGVVERWRLRVGNVEQQFVFETLPRTGDLVITIDTQSDLEASSADTITFGCELGRVEYGAATAIDAEGRRFAMSSTLRGGTIELRLAHHDLARAAMPLVIDPIASTVPLLSVGPQDYAPDVAYDAGSGRYVVVYEQTFSAADHDIYSELFDAAGTIIQGAYFDYTSEYWSAPRVANNALAGNFMCVAAVGAPASLRIIRGNTMVAATGVFGTSFTIAAADTWDKGAPDIGGDPALVAPTYYCVVWERNFSTTDHDVHARLVLANGTLLGPGTFNIDNTSNTYDERPAISKCDGNPPFATQEWTIVWQRYNPSALHWQIYGSQVHWDGIVTHPTYPIDVTADIDHDPRVSSLLDGDGVTRPYMVAYEAETLGGDWDVHGITFVGTTFLTGTSVPNQVSLATLDYDQLAPTIDSDGRHFTVAYAEENPNGTENYDMVVADLVLAGGYAYLCDSAILASSIDPEFDPAITSTYSAGGPRQRFLVAWERSNSQLGLADVDASLYDALQGGVGVPYCFGDGSATACPCGNTGATGNGCANSIVQSGGNLTWSGSPWVSFDTFVLHASGLPPGSVSLYFQGLPASMSGGYFGSPFGDGIRCIAQQIRRIGLKANPTGSSQYPESGDPLVSVKGVIPSSGTQVFYQAWYRNAGTFCTTATFNLTNGLKVVWAP